MNNKKVYFDIFLIKKNSFYKSTSAVVINNILIIILSNLIGRQLREC
jgi:hypothetical protein